MDSFRLDLAYAFRRLRQAPAFTAVAAATLALGIGANSAIFSVVNAVLLRPLPFEEPERLVAVNQVWEGDPIVYSPQNFLDVEAQSQAFESLAAIDRVGVTLTGKGAPARIQGAEVGAPFFDVLRVRPVLGRVFQQGDNEPGHTKIVILGERLWRDRFGGDAGLVGQTVQVNREPYLVVGVAPAGFSYPEGAEVWSPLEYDTRFRSQSRGAWYLNVIGRLKAGVPLERAREEVATIAARLAAEYPNADEGVGGTVRSLHEATVGRLRGALLLLAGAVGLVLLVACVNVANLLLSRVAARESELAVRTALGAARGRLVRQLLTESVLLAVLGGMAGVLLASFLVDVLLSLQPQGVPRLGEVRVDLRVVAFTAGLSLLTGLLFGVAPALQLTRRATAQSLRDGGRGILAGVRGRLRGGLVIAQIALAMVLLAGAGLLVRSFSRLRQVDPGFRTQQGLSFRVSLPESTYKEDSQLLAFQEALHTRLSSLPGVGAAGAVSLLPLSGDNFNFSFMVEGRPPLPPAQQPAMEVRVATPTYFDALGIPLRRGRGIAPGDTEESPQVVVISESAVRAFFPGEDPIGKVIHLGWGRGRSRKPGGEIVGVVGDVKERGIAEADAPQVYLPYAQMPIESMDVVLRTAVEPRALLPSAEKAVRELDPELPLARVATIDEMIAGSISQPRFYAILLGAFAATALSLAALGIFGVISYAVAQRSREIGIRIALGAHPRRMLGMMLGEAMGLAAAGIVAGLAGALALSRTIAGLLFELEPTDPATLASVAGLLALTAWLASHLAARKATRVDPAVALRAE
jgi:putative ABC transport system permease protein